MDHTLTALLFGTAAAFMAGMSKTGVPGVSLPAVVFMSYAFAGNAKDSVGALLPVLIIGDCIGVAIYRRHADFRQIARLFPCVALGMIPGALVLNSTSHAQFKLVLGWMVLILLVLEIGRQWFGWTRLSERRWFVAVMGVLAGFGTTVGNAAGPVMGIYLVAHSLPKNQLMGNWAWFFLIVNSVKVPIYLGLGTITTTTLEFSVLVIPAVLLGTLAGRRLFLWISQDLFDPLVLTLAGIAALRLVVP